MALIVGDSIGMVLRLHDFDPPPDKKIDRVVLVLGTCAAVAAVAGTIEAAISRSAIGRVVLLALIALPWALLIFGDAFTDRFPAPLGALLTPAGATFGCGLVVTLRGRQPGDPRLLRGRTRQPER